MTIARQEREASVTHETDLFALKGDDNFKVSLLSKVNLKPIKRFFFIIIIIWLISLPCSSKWFKIREVSNKPIHVKLSYTVIHITKYRSINHAHFTFPQYVWHSGGFRWEQQFSRDLKQTLSFFYVFCCNHTILGTWTFFTYSYLNKENVT